jgi:hypothetical protein
MKKTIDSWSFSRLAVFESCQYRAQLQYLDRVPDNTPRSAADRGTEIHKEAEEYVKGDHALPKSLAKFATDFKSLRSHYRGGRVLLEQEWGFDRNWALVDWGSAWLRLKCDAVVCLTQNHLVTIDYKTGQKFGNEVKHLDQLHLYALSGFLRYPGIKKVTTEDWYLDQNDKATHVMHHHQIPKHLANFDKRGKRMTETTIFKPNPNQFTCKYCPYGPDKQGDCKYGVSAKITFNKKPTPLVNTPSPTDTLFN